MIARLRERMRGDDGFSLGELMVSMTLMGIVTVISASGFLQMFRASDLTETAALTQTSTMAAFSKLDRDVRYGYRINQPYQRSNGDWAVEYVIPGTDSSYQCVRLTLPAAGGTLTRLQYPQSGTPAGYTPSAVALDMVPDNGSASPFLRVPGSYPNDNSNFDQLEIKMKSASGVAAAGAVRKFDLHFSALNTVDDSTSLACSQA